MSTVHSRIWLVAVTGLVLGALEGCAPREEPVAELRQAASIPNTGFAPYPILTEEVAPGQVEPVLAADGSYLPAWDGSVADLLAADAYADCATNSSSHRKGHLTLGDNAKPDLAAADQYLNHLRSRMEQVVCEPHPTSVYNNFVWRWLLNRGSSRCNVDPQSTQPAQLEFAERELNQYANFHDYFKGLYLPQDDWEDFVVDPLDPNANALYAFTVFEAGVELEYADLNLCMAQRLRAQLNGGQSLFTSTRDQTEIVAVMRERVQLAVVYYGLLAKLLSSTEPVPAQVVDNNYERLAFIRLWAEQAPSSVIQAIGEDFALAVRLHLEATHQLAALLERQAATRPVGDVGSQLSDRDWGLGQPRARLLNLLYGGDPIGAPEFPYPPGRSRGGVGRIGFFGGILPSYVRADMDDPRIGTLLGLARAADALLMKIENDESSNPVGFEVQASAERMYTAVETHLRVETCEIETPGDPSCDPASVEAALPELSQIGEYRLWQEHRIDLAHSNILVQAFDEAFGELVAPLSPVGLAWDYRYRDGMFHVLGAHQTETIAGDPWIHLDPEFTTAPFGGHELMIDFAELGFLPKTVFAGADPRAQGFVFHTVGQSEWNKLRGLGAIAALAFVREALVEGSEASAFAEPLFTAAQSALSEIDRAIGGRSVIVRPKLSLTSVSCAGGAATCQTFSQDAGTFAKHEVDVITPVEDPMDRLTLAPDSQQLHTVAVDEGSVGFDGVDRTDLDGYPTVAATTEAFSGYAAGYERRSFSYELDGAPAHGLYLRGDDPEGTLGEQRYMALFGHNILLGEAYFTSSGGALNAIGERTMAFQPYAWSRPAFDAFGFPTDWVPPADASLVGGAPGEPSYQYYLRSARAAAEEATAAVQKAIDNLVEETLISVERDAAEERAATIAELETRALCGEREGCEVPRALYRPGVVGCGVGGVPSGIAESTCNAAMDQIDSVLVEVPLPREVAATLLPDVAPVFQDLAGSELERVLVRQWNALKTLRRTVSSAESTAIGAALEVHAVWFARDAALSERDAAQANFDAEIAALDAGDSEIAALLLQLDAQKAELSATVGETNLAVAQQCSDEAFNNARLAGDSFSSARGVKVTSIDPGAIHDPEEWVDWDMDGRPDRSWSPGPLVAQAQRCQDAMSAHRVAHDTAGPIRDAREATEDALIAKRDTLTPLQREALVAELEAAEDRFTAAWVAAAAATRSAWTQVLAAVTQVQQAQGELVAAAVELDQARLRTENAVAAGKLERDLVEKQAATRYGLQRQFRSYDMWRARALLESARRMAVAARRAIEANFVVDLSSLQTQQAFVEAPSVWADEVYATDLDAPSVVGLSAAPEFDSTIYPNQLLDYVGNLERFVQGYTITYPTSVASPDTEVITLPSPEATQEVTQVIETAEDVQEVAVEVLSGDALGWTFFCPDEDFWLPHPGAGQVPLAARVATLCDGAPPTRMRYNFSLDPWARLDDSIGNRPLEQRHNVRWRRVAVNLIGTGIRDCQKSPSPEQCFSEAFLPFQLVHAGPAWTMNHSQAWRAFDLPSAFIENGKALAIEEWLDPIANSWTTPYVASVARGELFGRPVNGSYELIIEISPEVRLERLEQVQLLIETDYWVRQQ